MKRSELEYYQREVLVFAFRYCLGRSTYATGIMQDVLRDEWPNMSQDDQLLYKREIKEAHDRNQLGMEQVDAHGWLALLELP